MDAIIFLASVSSYEMLKSFKRGNRLLAIHINSIAGKNRQTKPLGPNPLEYVSVSFSANGLSATLSERNGGAWSDYAEIDGSASYAVNVGEQHRGKGFNFTSWYRTYDWVQDDGYDNLPPG